MWWHLLWRGRRYDVVHTASFPYFSLLAAAAVPGRRRFRLVVDWHEVWSRGYWQEYLGRLGGVAGWRIQRRCARLPQRAFCFSRLHAERLREEGLRGEITILSGQYEGPLEPAPVRDAEPLVVFAGRHIPEKCVSSIPPAVACARRQLPQLTAVILGDGPDRAGARELVRELGLDGVVQVPGFVPSEAVEDALSRAMCHLLPSRREGYGRVVLEAAARGTPSVLIKADDNAAVELISEGENGFVAASASADDLAEAIVRVHHAGTELRESTAAWFARNAPRLALQHSLEIVLAAYRAA